MNKRIILKTILVCLGIFLILISASIYFFSTKYELDTEKKYQVIIAAADIPTGEVITNEMVAYRTIKESGYNVHMMQNSKRVVGMKTLAPIMKGNYISEYNLIPSEKWYKAEDRTIILPMDVEGRQANLIKKGSLIDIRVERKDIIAPPQTVLSKVFVEDILDENGLSLGENIGSKKAYAKVVLNNTQRDRIYVASQYGRLIYELYFNNTQEPSVEDFVIPAIDLSKPTVTGTQGINSSNNMPSKEGEP
jgi:hypothetical protein